MGAHLTDTAVGSLPVVLVGGEEASGLADMLRQFIEQTLAESPRKVRQARALSGRAAFRSVEDAEVCVCITFAGDHIELRDGNLEPVRGPSIAADFLTIAHLTTGQENPFLLLLRRRLEARFSVGQIPFLLRLLWFMQIEPQERRATWVRWAFVVAAGTAILLGVYWLITAGIASSGGTSAAMPTGLVAGIGWHRTPAVEPRPPVFFKGEAVDVGDLLGPLV